MSTQESREPEVGRSVDDKADVRPLSEQHELLLMQFCDCELGFFGRLRAKNLLRSCARAREFVAQNNTAQRALSEISYSEKVDLWSRISAAIDNEEFAQRIISTRTKVDTSTPQRVYHLADSFRQLGWGASGVVVTAGLLMLVLRIGPAAAPKGESSFGAVTQTTLEGDSGAANNSRSGIYILNDHAQPAMEVDWMRSGGSVRVIPDNLDRNTILWVKRLKNSEHSGAFARVAPSIVPQPNN